jgi:hypothetical protein
MYQLPGQKSSTFSGNALAEVFIKRARVYSGRANKRDIVLYRSTGAIKYDIAFVRLKMPVRRERARDAEHAAEQ